MPRFLYFLPGLTGANPAILSQRGLLDRFERAPGSLMEFVIGGVDVGPEGTKGGCIVAPGGSPGFYTPDRQEWMRGLGPDGLPYWVGVEKPWPGPEDLVREVGITGKHVTLADGKAWRVPVLHRWDEREGRHLPNLPKAMRPRTDGPGVEFAVRAEYRRADELGAEIVRGFMESKTLSAEDAFETAVAVLNVNYRIGREESGLLGILAADDLMRVIEASVDVGAIQAQAMAMATDGMEVSDVVIQPE